MWGVENVRYLVDVLIGRMLERGVEAAVPRVPIRGGVTLKVASCPGNLLPARNLYE